VDPLIFLVAGALLLFLGATGRAESIWQSLTGEKKAQK
jgi:hypothetical protein